MSNFVQYAVGTGLGLIIVGLTMLAAVITDNRKHR